MILWHNVMVKKVYLIIGVFFLLLLIFLLAFLFITKKPGPTVSPLEPTPTTNNVHFTLPSPAPNGEYNVLLLGQGGAGHPGGILTDSMMVVHLNTINKTALLAAAFFTSILCISVLTAPPLPFFKAAIVMGYTHNMGEKTMDKMYELGKDAWSKIKFT
jgi:preprotein translocase subunit SecG